MIQNKFERVETFANEELAAVAMNVLNDKYATLQFSGEDNGCGGWDLLVRRLYQEGPVPDVTMTRLRNDVDLIRRTYGTTVRIPR